MIQWLSNVFGGGNGDSEPQSVDRFQQLRERGRGNEMPETAGRDLVSRTRGKNTPIARTARASVGSQLGSRTESAYHIPLVAGAAEDSPWTDSGV